MTATLTPSQALNIGPGPGQNHFNLGVGLPSGHVDYPQSDIAANKSIPNLSMTEDDWVRFMAYVNGKTTSDKTKYPRDELRELLLDGITKASWDGRTGKHRCGGVSRVMEVPKLKPWLCFTQIHDAKSDVIRLQTEGVDADHLQLVARSTAPGSSTEKRTVVRDSYKLGDPVEWDFEVIDGEGTLKLGGVVVERFKAGADCYFKPGGVYLQSNLDIEKDPTQRGVVDIAPHSLYHWHTGWPASEPETSEPGTGEPVPTKLKTITIIRHANKDDNHDGKDDVAHGLSEIGKRRALALPPLFTEPRADLFKPTWIFASGPAPTRMVQTGQPIAGALRLTINSSLDSEKAVKETAKLLVDQMRAGQDVLAILEHSAIAAVGAEVVVLLGGTWNAKPPKDWADDDWTSIWKFVSENGVAWTFSISQESVLPGDPGYVAPAPTGNGNPAPIEPPPFEPTPAYVTQAQIEAVLKRVSALEAKVFPTPTEPPVGTQPDGGVYYTVEPGDTLSGIARANGSTVSQLVLLNSLVDPSRIRVGQRLKIR